ncbi:MAG: UspA protein [Geobacteraceae bacterium]|jgi:nucleotide-binding universal stress UspA family protein|nr:UspA protein [Geobacteraceae bacterium]
MFKPSRILIPTDMSHHADKAIRQGFQIANQFGAQVFVLHVVQGLQQCAADYYVDDNLSQELQKQIMVGAREAVQKQVEKLAGKSASKGTIDVKEGVPYDEILNEANERKVDLIVISHLGTSGLEKYMIGSVARHVLTGAKCSVLLVR